MTLHIGDDNIVDIRKGNTKIAKVYHGSDLVWGYVPGNVLFESSTPGTYQLYVKCRCKLDIKLVGGGSGGAYSWWDPGSHGCGGGSGSYVHGIKEVFAGTYTIVVGSGGGAGSRVYGAGTSVGVAGGNSIAFGEIAVGGGSSSASYNGGNAGVGGVAQTTLSFINGFSGSDGGIIYGPNSYGVGASSVYGGYGSGGIGAYDATNGGSGYIKIVAV